MSSFKHTHTHNAHARERADGYKMPKILPDFDGCDRGARCPGSLDKLETREDDNEDVIRERYRMNLIWFCLQEIYTLGFMQTCFYDRDIFVHIHSICHFGRDVFVSGLLHTGWIVYKRGAALI